jgi:hypothetical protein
MSYDLTVEHDRLPDDAALRWTQLFAREGFVVELHPGFTFARHPGGFLTMRMSAAPAELIGRQLAGDSIGGFEVTFEDGYTSFRFGAGGPIQEIAMMCVGAALFAELTGGLYIDPQSGEEANAPRCLAIAIATAKRFLASARPSQLADHPFPGWAELGC